MSPRGGGRSVGTSVRWEPTNLQWQPYSSSVQPHRCNSRRSAGRRRGAPLRDRACWPSRGERPGNARAGVRKALRGRRERHCHWTPKRHKARWGTLSEIRVQRSDTGPAGLGPGVFAPNKPKCGRRRCRASPFSGGSYGRWLPGPAQRNKPNVTCRCKSRGQDRGAVLNPPTLRSDEPPIATWADAAKGLLGPWAAFGTFCCWGCRHRVQ
jgi:hypothetical protein